MSIINDALKKARRNEAHQSLDISPGEHDPLHPKIRSGEQNMKFLFIPILILLVVFMIVSAGLGYIIYKEFFVDTVEETMPDVPEVEESVIMDVEIHSPTPPEPLKADGKDEADTEPTAPTLSPQEILDQLQINGIMRGGSHPRLLTQSGVYREGDTIRQPEGYQLLRIGENYLLLRTPAGEEKSIDLP